jgi:hypothetical protein
MNAELDQLLQRAERPDRSAPAVSKWSIHQHLEHAALSARHIADFVRRLNGGQGEPGGRTRSVAHIVLLTGWIPRGKGQAPEFAMPGDAPDPARIRTLIEDARAILSEAGPPRGGHRLEHPLLGPFTARQWQRFGQVHTRHHLKIIRDIEKAAR